MSTSNSVKPAVLSVAPHPHGGLNVNALFACGHTQVSWFPHAPRRVSRQEIKGWVFGWNQQDHLCSWCEREARETKEDLVLERLPSGDYAWLRPEAK